MNQANAATAAGLKSWVQSANQPDCEFPIRNLPYGIFQTAGSAPRAGVAIGDRILDLSVLAQEGLLQCAAGVFEQPRLNDFIALGPEAWRSVRAQVSALLSGADQALQGNAELCRRALVAQAGAAMLLNWSELPIGYNGRASSVVPGGVPVRRPNGQIKLPDQERPVFGACRKL